MWQESSSGWLSCFSKNSRTILSPHTSENIPVLYPAPLCRSWAITVMSMVLTSLHAWLQLSLCWWVKQSNSKGASKSLAFHYHLPQAFLPILPITFLSFSCARDACPAPPQCPGLPLLSSPQMLCSPSLSPCDRVVFSAFVLHTSRAGFCLLCPSALCRWVSPDLHKLPSVLALHWSSWHLCHQ